MGRQRRPLQIAREMDDCFGQSLACMRNSNSKVNQPPERRRIFHNIRGQLAVVGSLPFDVEQDFRRCRERLTR